MTHDILQKILDEKGIRVKILVVQRQDYIYAESDYWVLYTEDLTYKYDNNGINRDYLIEPEKDFLAISYEEAIDYILDHMDIPFFERR